MIKIVKKFTIPILALLIVPFSAQGFFFGDFFDELEDWFSTENTSTQIINEVNVSANTGGNVADNGEIIEGEGKTEVEIKNIINGKEIEPVKIETKANEVSVESEIKVKDGTAEIIREIEIDSEKQTENYEINLENLTAETEDSITKAQELKNENEGILNNVQNWWLDLVEDIKSFFGNIFSIF